MSEIRIEGWRKVRMFDGLSLLGWVTGHPDPAVGNNGNATLTSFIVKETKGRTHEITTDTGTVYTLGKHSSFEDDT